MNKQLIVWVNYPFNKALIAIHIKLMLNSLSRYKYTVHQEGRSSAPQKRSPDSSGYAGIYSWSFQSYMQVCYTEGFLNLQWPFTNNKMIQSKKARIRHRSLLSSVSPAAHLLFIGVRDLQERSGAVPNITALIMPSTAANSNLKL